MGARSPLPASNDGPYTLLSLPYCFIYFLQI